MRAAYRDGLGDVAKRAGVAKGTIYLHFGKESMFEELIRTAIVPMLGRLQGAAGRRTIRDAVEGFARASSRRSHRPGAATSCGIVAEEPRFPSIADFYYREVVARGLPACVP